MPGQQGVARQLDGSFNVQCSLCVSGTHPTTVASGLTRGQAETFIVEHRETVHRFQETVRV